VALYQDRTPLNSIEKIYRSPSRMDISLFKKKNGSFIVLRCSLNEDENLSLTMMAGLAE